MSDPFTWDDIDAPPTTRRRDWVAAAVMVLVVTASVVAASWLTGQWVLDNLLTNGE